jgi:lysophospholipase L1-like esterase
MKLIFDKESITIIYKKILKLSFLVFFSFILFAIVLELSLQYYRWHLIDANLKKISSNINNSNIILSLGESTTYGLWVNPEQNYSYILEQRLNAYDNNKIYRVINLGFCGAITDDILECFQESLNYYNPIAVTVCMGVNDFSYMVNYLNHGLNKKGIHPFSFENSLVKPKFTRNLLLLNLISNYFFFSDKSDNWVVVKDREGHEYLGFYKEDDKYKQLDESATNKVVENIEKNYLKLIQYCKSKNIKLYIVSYINCPHANRISKIIATKYNVNFVDNEKKDNGKIWQLTANDRFHANQRGHQLMAFNIFKEMEKSEFFKQ